jgi:hypothetical protein
VRHSSAITGGYGYRLRHRVTTAASYTATNYDEYVGVTSTAAARTITLPTSAGGNGVAAGQALIIHDESGGAGTNNITITPNGSELIVGASFQSHQHERRHGAADEYLYWMDGTVMTCV